MKKYLLVLMVFILSFNIIDNAKAAKPEEEFGWDYTNGWFDKNPGKFVAPKEIYDNDLKTWVRANSGTSSSGSLEIKFLEPLKSGILGFYAKCNVNLGSYAMYSGSKKVYMGSACNEYVAVKIFDPIDRVVFSSHSFGSMEVAEFDLFDTANYSTVKNLKVKKKTFNGINIEWEKPDKSIGTRIYFNNVLVATLGKDDKSYKFDELKANTKYAISVSSLYKDGESTTNDITVTTDKIPDLSNDFVEVSDTSATSAVLKLNVDKLPVLPRRINIYQKDDGKNPEFVSVYTNNPINNKIANLKPETEYTYYLSVDYGNGNITNMVPVKFKTLEPSREVIDLSATATAQEVSLTWKMPIYKNLNVARIYREKDKPSFFARMFRSASTYEPIFETNGTSFKDLTVKADTEYKYKVTTVDKSGDETDGKIVTVQTKKMGASGGGVTLDPDGNYVVTWTNPVKGQMKVLVGGKQYTIVPAADKKVVILKDKMVFDLIGNPDVQLIPVDEDGKEGIPSKPGGNGTGNGGGIGDIVGGSEASKIVNAENTLKGGVELMLVIGGFLLLALAFLVVPRLVKLIRNSFDKTSNSKRRVG